MSPERSTFGVCPICHTAIPKRLLLIAYQKDGHRAVFAECLECEDPVNPR